MKSGGNSAFRQSLRHLEVIITIKKHLVPEYNRWLKQLGKKCNELRLGEWITQSKMAKKIGIDMKFYQDIEGGRRPVSTKTLYSISIGTDVSMERLVYF
jgi:DNA-binding XRE family transcriptional regulator